MSARSPSTNLRLSSPPLRTASRSATCEAYLSCASANTHGASQLPMWYSRHSFLGSVLQMRIWNDLRSVPTVSSFELPCVKGPYTRPPPRKRPSLVRRATSSRGYFSSVTRRYV